jgi:hypothetical protein
LAEIAEIIRDWQFLQTLPSQLHGFCLSLDLSYDDDIFHIFSYNNTQTRRSFTVVYDPSTKDFLGRVAVGLTEYYDVRYIVTDLAKLEAVLTERMDSTLLQMAQFDKSQLSGVFLAKKVLEWPYGRQLPVKFGKFELFITPQQPLPIINGSYIIIDYSDFSTASNLLILYNIYRDEFFGELRIKRTPHATVLFDAKTLDELEEKLTNNLVDVLKKMS